MKALSTAGGIGPILAIETSCDETACAILDNNGALLASEIASQALIHREYGGVVPEVASRNHLIALRPVIHAALQEAGLEIGAMRTIAATRGPGLSSSLLLGLSTAKAMATASGAHFVGVNHMEGHLLSPFFGRPGGVQPSMALVVSGGHTLLIRIDAVGRYHLLGRTKDDAAGEAFDKVAKLLGLPYPGGPEIDRLAAKGDPAAFDFPRSMLHSGDYNFSFSGIKTAVRYMLPKLDGARIEDVCASFQAAVVEVLTKKTIAAAREAGIPRIVVSGGVACNTGLRKALSTACAEQGIELLIAAASLCTDNAAMIAHAAYQRLAAGLDQEPAWHLDADPNLALV